MHVLDGCKRWAQAAPTTRPSQCIHSLPLHVPILPPFHQTPNRPNTIRNISHLSLASLGHNVVRVTVAPPHHGRGPLVFETRPHLRPSGASPALLLLLSPPVMTTQVHSWRLQPSGPYNPPEYIARCFSSRRLSFSPPSVGRGCHAAFSLTPVRRHTESPQLDSVGG